MIIQIAVHSWKKEVDVTICSSRSRLNEEVGERSAHC